jgi:serine/threonine protein kinase
MFLLLRKPSFCMMSRQVQNDGQLGISKLLHNKVERCLHNACAPVSAVYVDTVKMVPSRGHLTISPQSSYPHPQELLAASIRSMPFENVCKLWSLTSDFGGFTWELECDEGAAVFEPLTVLFEAWAARHTPLGGVANVLRIAAAAERLIHTLNDTSDSGRRRAEFLAELEELERQTTAAESAAQRFCNAHGALAEAVTQTLEAGGGPLSPGLVEARDAAFVDLQSSLQLLEECSSRRRLDALDAEANAFLTPIESAFENLELESDVKLAAALEDNATTSDDKDDKEAVDVCGATLRRTAFGILQRVRHSDALAHRFEDHCLARDGDKLLEAASSLRDSICTIVALEAEGEDVSLSAVLQEATPWDAVFACTRRRLGPLRAASERAGCLQRRASALRAEVDAFASGFAGREQAASLLEETYRAMKRARTSYRRLIVDHEANSDDDSDAGSPEELTRQRDICRAATASHDKAARQLFLAAKAYHPETLVEQQKRLRLTGLSAVWSDRTLDEYENCVTLARQGAEGGRHAMLKATFAGKPCVLKLVQFQQGQALCKEAEILRHLDHPNIVKLEAAFVQNHFLYLHFPLAKHGDLQQFLEAQAGTAAGARISAVQLRRMARQLCEAIFYLAERSIVHCDVKPANVFVAEEDGGSMPIAILGDFDVSHTASGRMATLTMALQTRGVATHYTAGYAAPEVVRAQPGQPPRATNKLDVYGLGCVIYHMHMYPRVLPEPERLDEDVASRAGLFDENSGGALPDCAVPAWAASVPREVIAGATRANPTARLSARELLQMAYMRQADGEYARIDVQRPAYWQNREHTGIWLVPESAEVVSQVEKLLNDTAKPETHGEGRSRNNVRFARFKVTSVQRVESSAVWSAYAERRSALADALAREGYALPEQARRLATSQFLYPSESCSLEGAAGEVFLFHGTRSPESIASSGFDARYAYAGAGAGAMFGRGVYFAESASKSDQYVSPSAGGNLTLVLSRVCLGRCQVVRDGRGRRNAPFLPEVEGRSTLVAPLYYDSILTEVSGMHFREVVVGRDTAAYPELLVEYERV